MSAIQLVDDMELLVPMQDLIDVTAELAAKQRKRANWMLSWLVSVANLKTLILLIKHRKPS